MVTVLDGGMGAELIRRSSHGRTPLWSAQALVDDPDMVIRTHRDYIDAGARMIITNSYSTVPSYLAAAGLESRYVEYTRLAGQLARQAVAESGERVLVAGSLPPLAESYRPDLVPSDEESRPIYQEIARALEPHIDVFLCETMSSAREGRNAATEAKAASVARGLPVYISWTLHEQPGTGLRSGESIDTAFEAVANLDLDGYLFNCTDPDAIEEGLRALARLTDKPIGGYPNRYRVPEDWVLGETMGEREIPLTTQLFVDAATRAFELGASIYGGCCTIGPADIAALSATVDQTH